MKYVYILLFIALAIVQWVIPGRMLVAKDTVLKKGTAFNFRTQPIDPSNPFKGRYIVLNFAETSFTDTVQRGFGSGDLVYVILNKDKNGFASIKTLSPARPDDTDAYVEASVYYTSVDNDSITVFLDYPFTEFYMGEFKAPKAEQVYRESAADTTKVTYARVKILNGDAVIEDVMINNISIRKLVSE